MGFYRSLKRKVESWNSLSKSDQGLFISAFFLLPLVAASLKMFGLQRTQRLLDRGDAAPRRFADEQTEADVRRAGRLVATACRWHPVRSSCLPRTILLWSLLRRAGMESDVRIGVRSDAHSQFAAHAWLEWNGAVINDAADVATEYLPFRRPAPLS